MFDKLFEGVSRANSSVNEGTLREEFNNRIQWMLDKYNKYVSHTPPGEEGYNAAGRSEGIIGALVKNPNAFSDCVREIYGEQWMKDTMVDVVKRVSRSGTQTAQPNQPVQATQGRQYSYSQM
jgi:hypothetical protein